MHSRTQSLLFAQSSLFFFFFSNQINKHIHQELLLFCICGSWFYSTFQKSLSLLFILIIYHFCRRKTGTQSSEKDQRAQLSSRLFFLFNPQGPDWIFLCLLLFYIYFPHSIYPFWFLHYTTVLRATVLSESFLLRLWHLWQPRVCVLLLLEPSAPNYFRPPYCLIFSSLD